MTSAPSRGGVRSRLRCIADQMSIHIGRESKSDNLMVYGIPRGGVIVTDIEGTNRCSRMSNWSF